MWTYSSGAKGKGSTHDTVVSTSRRTGLLHGSDLIDDLSAEDSPVRNHLGNLLRHVDVFLSKQLVIGGHVSDLAFQSKATRTMKSSQCTRIIVFSTIGFQKAKTPSHACEIVMK